jgi:hypothetical protein
LCKCYYVVVTMKNFYFYWIVKNFHCGRFLVHIDPLLICTWFLKNQFGKIKFHKLDFQSISNLIFTACVACKNQFRNWFLHAENPVCRTWFLQLDFSKIKYRSTGVESCFIRTSCLLQCLQHLQILFNWESSGISDSLEFDSYLTVAIKSSVHCIPLPNPARRYVLLPFWQWGPYWGNFHYAMGFY